MGNQSSLVKLPKGKCLFEEGEPSRSLYVVKSGALRIFKRRGESTQIEIDVVRAGQIVGELAFLDALPRSASAEALLETELIEIPSTTFNAAMENTPEWLQILVKAISARLRASSKRIQQLETASKTIDYSKKEEGEAKLEYAYLPSYEANRVFVCFLLAARSGNGNKVRLIDVERYANQILGIPLAKITSATQALNASGAIRLPQGDLSSEAEILDFVFLEDLIQYLNQENLAAEPQRHDLSERGFKLMSAITKHLDSLPENPSASLITVNVVEATKGQLPLDGFEELVKLGYASTLAIQSASEALTTLDPTQFNQQARFQAVVRALAQANGQGSPHT